MNRFRERRISVHVALLLSSERDSTLVVEDVRDTGCGIRGIVTLGSLLGGWTKPVLESRVSRLRVDFDSVHVI